MSLLDSLTGLLTGGQSSKESDNLDAANAAAQNLVAPTAQQLQVALQQEVSAGTITPAQYQAIMQDPNAMQNILSQINPAYTQAQNTALSQLQNVASSNGMTPQFQNQLNLANQSTNANLQGQYGAIQQQAQQQGVGGSGSVIANKLSALQAGANSNNLAGEQAASNAQSNALQAMYGAGNLGQSAQAQAFGEQSNIAQAQNAINQFNAQNKNASALYNTGAANQAQYANLQNQQNINNANTGIANTESLYNAATPQTAYSDSLNRANLIGQTAANTAKSYNSLGLQNMNTGSSFLSAAKDAYKSLQKEWGSGDDSGGGGDDDYGDDYFDDSYSDERLKKNITKFNTDDFLNHITGYKYNYKSDANLGHDNHSGPMAQDFEKSAEGKQLVQNTPMGKKVNYSKAGGHIFSALADIHKRVKSLEGSGKVNMDDKIDNQKFGKL